MRAKHVSPLLFAVAATASPALADLVVTHDLGAVASGVQNLSGNTSPANSPNNAFVYTSVSNTGTTLWGNGEVVYQFELTKPAYLYLTDTTEVTTVTFPKPNTDYFLLGTKATFNSDNTATSSNTNFPNFTGKPEGTSLAFVDAAFNDTTPTGSGNIGMLKSTANPNALYGPGVYYLAVDGRSGTLASYGQSNQTPGTDFTAKLHIAYVDEVQAPSSTGTTTTVGSSTSIALPAMATAWASFVYQGGALNLDTHGTQLGKDSNNDGIFDAAPSEATVLALYDSQGKLILINDDDPAGGLASKISLADGTLVVGQTYYLGVTAEKSTINPGFDMQYFFNYDPAIYGTVYPWFGTVQINGLAAVPEPATVGLALTGLALVAVRRRRA